MKNFLKASFDTVLRYFSLYVPFSHKVLLFLPAKKTMCLRKFKNQKSSSSSLFKYFYNSFFLLVCRYNKSTQVINKEVCYTDGEENLHLLLNVNETTQCGLYLELPNPELVELIVKGGKTFVDIGSNIGFFSLIASRYFDQIISFEPTVETINSFRRNISLNKIKNICLEPIGLSDIEGQMILNENPLNMGGNSFEEMDREMVQSSHRDDWVSYNVDVLTLDNYMSTNSIEAIDLIKIDVENHEPNVVRGAINTLKKFRPLVYMEIGGKKTFLEEIIKEMPALYKVYNPITMTQINLEQPLPWDVLFIPNKA